MQNGKPPWYYNHESWAYKILNRIYVADLIYLAFGGLLGFIALYGFSGCLPAPRTGSAPGAEPLGAPHPSSLNPHPSEERKDKCATSPKPH